MEREKDFVRLVVEDDGKGLKPNKRRKGLGLHIMRYRCNVLGGDFAIEVGQKAAPVVVATVPVKNKKRH